MSRYEKPEPGALSESSFHNPYVRMIRSLAFATDFDVSRIAVIWGHEAGESMHPRATLTDLSGSD